MTRFSKACLGVAALLTAVLVAGAAVAGARALGSATVAPAHARLGLVRVALRPGQIGLDRARPLAVAPECDTLCPAVPQPQVAAAIAVVAAGGEAKKVSASSPGAPAPVASSVALSPEPEPPAVEAQLPLEEVEAPPESSEASSDPGCPIEGASASAPIAMSVLGCGLVASDTSAEADPIPFWGTIECANASRYSYGETGGDTHLTANGEAPDGAYRRLTVLDGDDFYGERCELGENDHNVGPTVFYHEGQQRITYYSERLPANFPLSTSSWQTVMQMKQTQPSDDDCCGPQLEMEARQNRWIVVDSWKTLWEFPARRNVWTRFAWDVYYSQDASKGWLQVSADLNDDGDFNDPGERSPVLHGATLRTEPEGPNGSSDGLAAGDSIPSHLRVGIYHDPEISCAAPVECSVEVDNVQVVQPSS